MDVKEVQIAASGNDVHVAYVANVSSAQFLEVCTSQDRGKTFGTPRGLAVTRGASLTSPRIAALGNLVVCTWSRVEPGGTFPDIEFARSTTGSATWSTPARLDVGTPRNTFASAFPSLALGRSTSHVYVAWVDNRNHGATSPLADVYFNSSADGGVTWQNPDRRIDLGRAGGSAISGVPSVAAAGATVLVAWQDTRSFVTPLSTSASPDVYCNRSTDGGVTWATDFRLNGGTPAGSAAAGRPRLAMDGSTVVAVWREIRSGSQRADIYCNVSTDTGATWLANAVRLDVGSAAGAADSLDPEVAVSGQFVYVVWPDARNGATDIYCNVSRDFGRTWGTEVRIDSGTAGIATSRRPSVAAQGAFVQVAWDDFRSSSARNDIYSNRSLDGGRTWLAADRRLDLGSTPGAANSWDPVVAVALPNAYVAWQDYRTPQPIAVLGLASGYELHGMGLAGSGGFIPAMSASGTAAIGGTLNLRVANVRGAAPAIVAVGSGAFANLPIFGGILYVAAPLTFPVPTSGAPGAPGAGAGNLTLPVPPAPNLLGFRMNVQALAVDPSAPAGLSMSNAIAVWGG